MHVAVVDFRTSNEEIDSLLALDLTVILCPPCSNLYEAVCGHPDMQISFLENKKVVVQRNIAKHFTKILLNLGFHIIPSQLTLTRDYPQDIILNSLILGDKFIHKLDSTDPVLLHNIKNKKLINVRQGYTKCSTAVLSSNAAMTSDKGIYLALSAEGVDVLFLPPGDILLPGLNYGFIGGCCGLIKEGYLGFFGELSYYSYGKEVLSFLKKHNIIPVYLKKGKLIDRGTLFCLEI